MDIERALKNIGDWISKETESRKYPKSELLELSESLQALKAEIARQSATSEEVQRAIEWAEQERKHSFRYMDFGDADSASLAITALQSYQPTTRKNRTVEEAAISKTETTSCKWCDNADEMEVAVKTVFNSGKSVGIKRFSSSKSTFCPNCGRKLEG